MPATDRIGDGDEAGTVGKDGLHLDLGHDVGHARQDISGSEHGPTPLQCVPYAESIPGRFGHGVGHNGDGFRDIQPEPPGLALAGQ